MARLTVRSLDEMENYHIKRNLISLLVRCHNICSRYELLLTDLVESFKTATKVQKQRQILIKIWNRNLKK